MAARLTRQKAERLVLLLNEFNVDLAEGYRLNAAANEVGLMFSDLGTQHAVPGMAFWQTPFGDLLTDGEGNWHLTES